MQNSNTSTTKRNRATKALAGICGAALLVGSMAYFTDRVEYQANGTAGNVQIESTAFAGANNAGILVDRDGKDNLNPGDVRDLTFTVSNMGSKAVDIRHTLKLTVKDGAGNALNLTDESAATVDQLEFDIYKAGDVTYTASAGYVIAPGAKPVFSGGSLDATKKGGTRTVSDNTVTYHFADTTLLGKDGLANAERVENATLTADTDVPGHIDVNDTKDGVTYEYVLVFRDSSLNKFMNAAVQVDMAVEAKQHYNTNDDWTTVATQSFTAGSISQNAVPDHAEDTVGGTAVNGQNNITPHDAIVGTATKNQID